MAKSRLKGLVLASFISQKKEKETVLEEQSVSKPRAGRGLLGHLEQTQDHGIMKHDTWACYKPSGRGFSDCHGFFSFGVHVIPGPQVAAILWRHFVDSLWLLVDFNLNQES